ncbi:MAG: NACHT domain-containing protein [Janthinobacterium lividum]
MALPISKETLALLSAFKSPISEGLKEIKNEVTFFFDDGVASYIDNLRDKIIRTKTFLHRNEDVYFYDTYFPVTLTRKSGNKQIAADSHEPFELFKLKKYISIIGNAGSGKTMLMKHCFLSAIDQNKYIPILIELRNLNREQLTLTDYIYKIILKNKLSPNQRIVERILEKGKFLFLLDGFDEIFSTNKAKIVEDIEDFVDKFSKNNFLITSRPGANAETLSRFLNYNVAPLSKNEIKRFTHVQLRDDPELESRVLATIDLPENKEYNSYLSSPLLLSMFILTYNLYPELPKSKSKFYWNVFDTLCTKHDSYTKKGGFLHERKSGLQNEELENVLKWLGYVTLFEGKYSFDEQYLKEKLKSIRDKLELKFNLDTIIEDFIVSISILILDGLEYKFPHKSLQEYFAALLVREQSAESKARVYSERFPVIERKSTGGSENLWSICVELDKHAIYEHFFIKHLSDFLNQVNKGGQSFLVKNFYKYFKLGEGFSIKEDKVEYISFRIPSGPIFPIANFFGCNASMFGFNISQQISKKQLLSKEIIKYVASHPQEPEPNPLHPETGLIRINYTDLWNTEIEKIISGSSLEKNIIFFIKEVTEILTKIKAEIAHESKAKNDLLDL